MNYYKEAYEICSTDHKHTHKFCKHGDGANFEVMSDTFQYFNGNGY